MKLVDQWTALEARLPKDWKDARLRLTTENPRELPRAAAALGPLGAGRADGALVFHVYRTGATVGPELVRRLFSQLDRQRVWCILTRDEVIQARPEQETPPHAVAASWDDALAQLPLDWTELLCRLEIRGSAVLPRAALLCAPINPTRDRDSVGFLFRVGRVGYGVSQEMARRCFERLDEERIGGSVTVLRVLSDTHPVASQGSSWIVSGRVL